MSRKCARRKAFSAPFIELSVAYTLGVGKCCEYFIILLYAASNGCLAAWLTDSSLATATVVADWQAFLLVSAQTLTDASALVRDHFAPTQRIRLYIHTYICTYVRCLYL